MLQLLFYCASTFLEEQDQEAQRERQQLQQRRRDLQVRRLSLSLSLPISLPPLCVFVFVPCTQYTHSLTHSLTPSSVGSIFRPESQADQRVTDAAGMCLCAPPLSLWRVCVRVCVCAPLCL